MDILAFHIFDGDDETGPVPPRFEMVVADEDFFSTPRPLLCSRHWRITEWGEHGITFISELPDEDMSVVPANAVGSRYGFDLLGAYGPSAARDYITQRGAVQTEAGSGLEGGSELEGGSNSDKPGPNWEGWSDSEVGSIPWEGRLNASGILSSPVYPVTVFTPNNFVSLDIFFPVIYLWELMDIYGLDEWQLKVSEICALHGDVVFQLNQQ